MWASYSPVRASKKAAMPSKGSSRVAASQRRNFSVFFSMSLPHSSLRSTSALLVFSPQVRATRSLPS